MAKPWRRSKSLIKLVSQINAAYPSRDTTSDGAIGDAGHATRNSDHNPWVVDRNGQPVVTAQDIDEDLAASNIKSIQAIVNEICASRDRRVKYIIYEGQITVKGSMLQRWQPYTGKNAHKHHVHISVFPDQKLYDDDSEWSIGPAKPAAATASKNSAVDPALAGHAQSVTEDVPASPQAGDEPTSTDLPPTMNSGLGPNKASTEAGAFNAFVPQIDTAKTWLKRATAGTGLGAILAFIFQLPEWLQIGLFGLLVIIVIGGIVILIKYHGEIFAYVTKMNTLRATDGVKDPVIVGRPPTD